MIFAALPSQPDHLPAQSLNGRLIVGSQKDVLPGGALAVSYTHLTLPTNSRV